MNKMWNATKLDYTSKKNQLSWGTGKPRVGLNLFVLVVYNPPLPLPPPHPTPPHPETRAHCEVPFFSCFFISRISTESCQGNIFPLQWVLVMHNLDFWLDSQLTGPRIRRKGEGRQLHELGIIFLPPLLIFFGICCIKYRLVVHETDTNHCVKRGP